MESLSSPVYSAGSAWLTLQALRDVNRPEEEEGWKAFASSRDIAWKTGTSFGFRDAWAVGVTDGHTVGVWVGRPDGTPNPGFFGANVAAPLLVDIFAALPEANAPAVRKTPASVTQARVCWPLGTRHGDETAPYCHVTRTAWLLDGVAPPTFADRLRSGEPRYSYLVEQRTGLRAAADCARGPVQQVAAARWPAALEPWLENALRHPVLPPAWSPGCRDRDRPEAGIKIGGVADGEILHRAQNATPLLRLQVRGQQGEVNWAVNGKLVARTAAATPYVHAFKEPGGYDITAFDDHGRYDRLRVSVR